MRRPARPPRPVGEAGSGSVLVVGVVAVMLVVLVAALTLAAVVRCRHAAEGAADLAALAGAGVLADGTGAPCAWAGAVAARNGARLATCAVQGDDVVVEAVVPLPAAVGGLGDARARARAGPQP